jgi:hypothetical protein
MLNQAKAAKRKAKGRPLKRAFGEQRETIACKKCIHPHLFASASVRHITRFDLTARA